MHMSASFLTAPQSVLSKFLEYNNQTFFKLYHTVGLTCISLMSEVKQLFLYFRVRKEFINLPSRSI